MLLTITGGRHCCLAVIFIVVLLSPWLCCTSKLLLVVVRLLLLHGRNPCWALSWRRLHRLSNFKELRLVNIRSLHTAVRRIRVLSIYCICRTGVVVGRFRIALFSWLRPFLWLGGWVRGSLLNLALVRLHQVLTEGWSLVSLCPIKLFSLIGLLHLLLWLLVVDRLIELSLVSAFCLVSRTLNILTLLRATQFLVHFAPIKISLCNRAISVD